ncbi:MAG: ribbon-helix-helix protein, CopG family [Chloroflexota bacterium]|nr:ribbon-helix-helix protein, CopG family [Chloroflexota bacterium]
MSTVTLSTRVPEALRNEVDALASALRRDRAWIVEDAVRRYLTEESQFISAVAAGRAAIVAGQFVTHEEMQAELDQIDAEQR